MKQISYFKKSEINIQKFKGPNLPLALQKYKSVETGNNISLIGHEIDEERRWAAKFKLWVNPFSGAAAFIPIAFALFMLLGSESAYSICTITNPTPYNGWPTNYGFTTWNSTQAAGTYPASMMFHYLTAGAVDPSVTGAATEDYVIAYNLTSSSRIEGQGANGFSFINTSAGHTATGCLGNLGEAVLALNTSGRTTIQVSWTAGTILTGTSIYKLRAQYRIGTSGSYTDLPNTGLTQIEYTSGATGNTANFGPITLPATCEDIPVVQIRWIYYFSSGSSARAKVNLTNISVASAAGTPALNASSSSLGFGNQLTGSNSASQNFNLSGSFLTGAPGNITVTSPSADFQVSNDNSNWGAITTIAYAASKLVANIVYARFTPQSAGAKSGNITFSGGGVSAPPSVAVSGTGQTPVLATNLSITNISPLSPIVNSVFSATVQSQDSNGIAQNVNANTDISLTVNTGTGSLTGTVTGTIPAGTNTITINGIIYSHAESNVSLLASRTAGDNLIAATSANFAVQDTANQLSFVGIPSTGHAKSNLISFTVEARTAGNIVDSNYTGNVTVAKNSGTGTLSGTLTKAVVKGIATFSDLQFDTAGIFTVAAFSGSLPSTISGNITITILTDPSPFDLSSGDYSFTTWNATSPIGTYPNNMIFHYLKAAIVDPLLTDAIASEDYYSVYNLSSGTRIEGQGSSGISFINTSPGHTASGYLGDLGEAVIGLNTTGRSSVQVSWLAGTILTGTRPYNLRCQYRVGNSSNYSDLPNTSLSQIEYTSGATGNTANFGPITLPAACENQSLVQLRWVYYYGGSGSNTRAKINLANINISSLVCSAPAISGVTSNSPACTGSNINLGVNNTGSATLIYSWSGPDGFSSTLQNPVISAATVSAGGTYSVTVSNSCGTVNGTVAVSVNISPAPMISGNTSFCQGGSSMLNTGAYAAYLWSPSGQTTQSITITSAGNYATTVTDNNGCSGTATINTTTVSCPTFLNLNLFISGYYVGSGEMQPVLFNEGVSNSMAETDSVLIELHDATTPSIVVESAIAILMTDGSAMAVFGYPITNHSFWIVVKHRNSVETWSAAPVAFTSTTAYDFTTSKQKAYGNNMVDLDGPVGFYSGDFNQDENIDLIDFPILDYGINNGLYGYFKTDLNGDGNVDLLDFPELDANINSGVFAIHP